MLLVAGLLAGLQLAARLLSVNLLVLHSAINAGFQHSFKLGGLATLASFVAGSAAWLFLAGGLTQDWLMQIMPAIAGLALLATGFIIARYARLESRPAAYGLMMGATSVILTLSNPLLWLTNMSFAAEADQRGGLLSLILLLFMVMGSLLWWLMISWSAARLARHLSERWIIRVNRGLGLLLTALGFVWLSLLVG